MSMWLGPPSSIKENAGFGFGRAYGGCFGLQLEQPGEGQPAEPAGAADAEHFATMNMGVVHGQWGGLAAEDEFAGIEEDPDDVFSGRTAVGGLLKGLEHE